MTDGQIIDERFLVYINDLLSSGYIPDLMTNEEKDEMCNAVRNECQGAAGIIDSPENLWDFFLDKVRTVPARVPVLLTPSGTSSGSAPGTSRRSSTAPSSTGSSLGRTKRSCQSPGASSSEIPDTRTRAAGEPCSSTARSRTHVGERRVDQRLSGRGPPVQLHHAEESYLELISVVQGHARQSKRSELNASRRSASRTASIRSRSSLGAGC